jgi:hypothetical protein
MLIKNLNLLESFDGEVTRVLSTVDNRRYLVRNLPDKKQAADKLAIINGRIRRFIATMDAHSENVEMVRRIIDRFNGEITESRHDSRYTSFTENKGSKISLCIRDGRQGQPRITDDDNTMSFVILHEIAHIASVSTGHTKEFWDNFRYLLKFAIQHGFYKYVPYHQRPQQYCGTLIAETPLESSS